MSEINTINGYEIADKKAREDISTITDFIVEQGVNEKTPMSTGLFGDGITWLYRKWNSGLVECYGKTNSFMLIQGGYMSVGVPLPFEFSEPPTNISYNFFTTQEDIDGSENPQKTYALTGGSNKTWIKPYIRTEATLNNVTLHINIIGKWK